MPRKKPIGVKDLLTDEYAALVNDLVPNASAAGAYCIGMVSVAALQNGIAPSRALLEAASICPDPESAVGLIKDMLAPRKKRG